MAAIIYSLCALTCLICALMLLRAYGHTRSRMLFWSGACFVGLTAGNILLVVDRILLPATDLTTARLTVGLVSVLLLLYGLTTEGD